MRKSITWQHLLQIILFCISNSKLLKPIVTFELEKMQWPIGYLHTTQILFCTYLLEAKCLSSSKMLVSMHLSGWIEMVKSEFFNSAIQSVAFYFINVFEVCKRQILYKKISSKRQKRS